jgi:hypothetical protein
MSDFVVFIIFTFILFGFIFIAGFMCGSITTHFDNRITSDKVKKLIAKEPSLTVNMIYKKYKVRFPTLTKRLIWEALNEETDSK